MYIAIDIGGTNIRVASFSSLSDTNLLQSVTFGIENDYEHDIQHISNTILNQKGMEEITGIGISLAGVLNTEKTKIVVSAFLSDWVDKPFSEDLVRKFDCSVVIENDATAAAVGEAVFGEGKGKDFLYIIWGTGIGGSVVKQTNGIITVESFEPGHQIIDWDGERCTCGQKGCLEFFCSGGNIQKKFNKDPKDLEKEDWEKIINAFAHGLANVVIIRPTKLVIFSGGVITHNPQKLSYIQELLKKHITVTPIPELAISTLGKQSGLYGALALLNMHFQHK